MTRCLLLLSLLVAACGGGAGSVAPVAEAEEALQRFMQASADSNHIRMAENWGTARGSAAETNTPPDYRQRMAIVQAYLKGVRYRVMSNEPATGASNQRVLQVELTRGGCVTVVPFTMVLTGRGGWVVNHFDLEKVGAPGRRCNTAQPSGGS